MTDSLPTGWATASLGDICVQRVPQAPPTEHAVPYIDISAIDRATKRIGETKLVSAEDAPTRARQWVRAGDVLVSMTRPNLNAVALVHEDLDGAVASTGFDVLRPVAGLPEWVFYRVRTNEFVADVCEDLQGVVYPAIRPRDVRRHRLPLPPEGEQHRIVEALESYLTRLDDAVAMLERVQRNLKRYRASVLKAAVEGRLVPTEAELARAEGRDYEPASVLLERILAERRRRWEDAELAKMKAKGKILKDERWRAKYQEPVTPDTSQTNGLPVGWCWVSVEQLGFIASGQTPKGVTSAGARDGDVPWFRVGDMNAESNQLLMTVANEWLTTDQVSALGLHVRPIGTIVFPKRGGAISTNKKRLLGRPAAYDLNTMGVVPIGDVCSYLWVWFLGVDLGSLADGSNVPQINHGDIAPLAVPLPPAAEQSRIVNEVNAVLSVADEVTTAVSANRLRSTRLRQSILKWAFEGRLVDQDPTDEPASQLLERIRAERESTDGHLPRSRRRPRARSSKA